MIQKFMKNRVLWVLLVLSANSAYSQITYTSRDNRKNDWSTASHWTFTGGASPTSPGNPTTGSASAIKVYGYTRSESTLTVNNGSAQITVYDTLFIVGDFDLGQGKLTIQPGAVLVVTGDLNAQNGLNTFTNNGNVVVKGKFKVTNGSIVNNSNLYVFGATQVSGGGKINGCDGFGNPSGCNPATAGNVKNSAALQSGNSSLYNFVANGGVLPITLTFFKVMEVTQEGIALVWETATELNFDHFNLQRSVNGKDFKTIAEVQGHGTTKESHSYSFTDKMALSGTSYYRLQSIDFDGYTETFNVVAVKFEEAKEVALYPNPVTDSNLNFQLNFQPATEILVTITSVAGIEHVREVIKANETNINLGFSLAPGIYIVKMASIDFNKVSRIVVK